MVEDFDFCKAARQVSPAEYLVSFLDHQPPEALVDRVVAEAMACAADERGVLTNFSHRDFFEQYVAKAIVQDADPAEGKRISYHVFVAMSLMDSLRRLYFYGLLGHRADGATMDYCLSLPLSK